MNLPLEPLDEAEMEELDRFLLYRGKADIDDTFVEGLDEGILTLSELDGFFTAIVSGPEMIVPSRWLPAIWGDVEPVWASQQTFEHIFELLVRHMNGVVDALCNAEQGFEPLFMEQVIEGRQQTLVHEWCSGYMLGTELAPQRWESGGDEVLGLLAPIDIFTNDWGWKILAKLNGEEKAVLKAEIGPAAHAIYHYWQARRGTHDEPFLRGHPEVGRNEPCPCGSGKKFKQCCLH